MLRLLVAILCLLYSATLWAKEKEDKYYGRLNGSIETSWGLYADDPGLSTPLTQSYGTNTYINLGYTYKGFRSGLQYDIYGPQMIGFDSELKGNGLKGFYAGWSFVKWDITAGTFFEQYGSGLLFRAFEQRDMGINTAVLGANVKWYPFSWLSAKAMAGIPRRYMELFNSSTVYGADLELFPLQAFMPQSETVLTIGGSWLMRNDMTQERPEYAPSEVNGYSLRMGFYKGSFSFGGEYVQKSEAYSIDPRLTASDNLNPGRALLLNMDISFPSFGMTMVWRSIENAYFRQDDSHETTVSLNYIPSLTKQHRYALFQLYPHEVLEYGGETGGSVDIAGSMRLGGNPRRPLKYSLNASVFWDMEYDMTGNYRFMSVGGSLLWAEAYLDLEKRLGRNWKTTLAAGWQRKPEFSRFGMGEMLMDIVSTAADILWQLSPKYSLRMELQHAWSNFYDEQGWMMGLVELGIAPGFMFYVSDMLNYRTAATSNTHYYDIGLSYSRKSLRTSLSYGRHREGYICSGGICRYVPEYTGMNLMLSIIF